MSFGDQVSAPATASGATWLSDACRGAPWTVGALVPNDYDHYLRVHAPSPEVPDWWSAYRRLFETVVAVGQDHTACADRAWFAVWDGHAFTRGSNPSLWQPLSGSESRTGTTRGAPPLADDLGSFPRFGLPNRTYFLLQGSLSAATQLVEPGTPNRWINPDLFWPDDRRWFVGSDVDFWSLYVGGDHALISALHGRSSLASEYVQLDQLVEVES